MFVVITNTNLPVYSHPSRCYCDLRYKVHVSLQVPSLRQVGKSTSEGTKGAGSHSRAPRFLVFYLGLTW